MHLILRSSSRTFTKSFNPSIMGKVFIMVLIVYLLYKFVFNPAKTLKQPQEPDLFIDHEEIKKEHEQNK